MRIGFDAKRAFVNTSGLGNYSRFIITSLLHQFPEHEYLLYTPKQLALFQDFYRPAGRDAPTVITPEGLWKRLPSVWRTFGLASDAKRRELDLFHGLSNELPRAMRQSTKTIVTIHDLIFLRFPELFSKIDRTIYQNKFRRACEQADRIVAISEQTKQDIVDFYQIDEDRIEVIYQDCDAIFHHPAQTAMLEAVKRKYRLPDRYVLSVGTHEPRKNQLNLLQAWHQANTALDLVLVGKQTKYSQLLFAYIQQHNLEKRVHIMPYIPDQELPAIYQQATVFAYPSVFEGFGIPILEALNSGVPVITSKGSCFSEAGGEGALYIDPASVQELTDAIVRLGESQGLREKLISKGRAHAMQFRPEHTISQLHQLYRSVLNQ